MTTTVRDTIPEGIQVAREYIKQLELEGFGWDLLVGDAFVRGMRDIGYKSTSFALCELIDNAIQALATHVDIVFGFDGGTKPSRIAVIDDGYGMEPKMVRASLIWGAGTRAENRVGFGKYGYGLPSASVSQCHRVTVYSVTRGSQWYSSYLDIDEIKNGDWTKGNRIEMPAEQQENPPQFVLDHIKKSKYWREFNHGTVVVWEHLDRVNPKLREGLRASLVTELGVTYRNFLVETPMSVDGQAVQPCDPLFLTEGFRYYDLDPDRAVAYDPAVVEVKDKDTGEVVGRMRVRFARKPATFFRKPEYKNTNKPGRTGMNERLEIANANMGIIFCRNGRQIDVLRPPRSIGSINATTDRFWGIEVDFDATLDEMFAITTAKQQVRPEDRVWDMLKDKAGLFAAIGTMRGDYKKDAAIIAVRAEENKQNKRPSVESIEGAQKFRTTKPPRDSDGRRKEAENNLAQEAERRAKRSGMDPRVVERELTAQQEGNAHVVEHEDLPGAPFFRCQQRGGQRVLLLNTAHPFYEQVYSGNGSNPKLRAGLEILLWALGEAEVDADPGSDRRLFYERERGSVWSPYLADALKVLSSISIVDSPDDVLPEDAADAGAAA